MLSSPLIYNNYTSPYYNGICLSWSKHLPLKRKTKEKEKDVLNLLLPSRGYLELFFFGSSLYKSKKGPAAPTAIALCSSNEFKKKEGEGRRGRVEQNYKLIN